jgi:hypothetical protein
MKKISLRRWEQTTKIGVRKREPENFEYIEI